MYRMMTTVNNTILQVAESRSQKFSSPRKKFATMYGDRCQLDLW